MILNSFQSIHTDRVTQINYYEDDLSECLGGFPNYFDKNSDRSVADFKQEFEKCPLVYHDKRGANRLPSLGEKI